MVPQTAVIELLDSQQGYVLQSWTVRAGDVLQLGRSASSDVCLRNPFVSRSHAYVQWENGHWEIHSLSEGGLIINDRFARHTTLESGMEFRLARKGPLLRFRREDAEESTGGGSATIQWDEESAPLLILDRTRRDEEVAEIEQQSYFGDLQRIAAQLRSKRSSGE